MSLNVYFTQEIENLPGFTVESYKDGSKKKIIDDLSLHNDSGRLYAILYQDSVLPDKLKDCIDHVSLYETMPQMGKRVAGIYRHESAEGELEPDPYSKQAVYKVKIIGKNMKDVRELFRMIKLGSILPKNEDSYENAQTGRSGCSCAQDKAELQRVSSERDDLSRKLDISETMFHNLEKCFLVACEKNVLLRGLAEKLRGEMWGLCRKLVIAKRINKILDVFPS